MHIMENAALLRLLDDPSAADETLRRWGLRDPHAGQQAIQNLAALIPLDLVAALCRQLERHLGLLPQTDRTLAGLVQFVSASRSPLSLVSLLERDATALPMLLQVLGTSEAWTDLLCADPEAFDLLRLTEGQPTRREVLHAEILREVESFTEERAVMATLRRIHQRETLRIGYGELFRHVRLELSMQQRTYLAEALVMAALAYARRYVRDRTEIATLEKLPLTVIGLGRLGGEELDYRLPLAMFFVCGNYVADDGRRGSPSELIDRVVRHTLRLLSEVTEAGAVFEISTRVRPEGEKGPLVARFDQALYYFDALGRTWERGELLQARPIAGDISLGAQLIQQLQPWLYRRYLSRADETGIKAWKRRILQRLESETASAANTNSSEHPAATISREIEEVVHFLQLLNGGELTAVRRLNVLQAIGALEQANVLTVEERSILERGYENCRRLEHLHQLRQQAEAPTNEQRREWQQQRETIQRLLTSAFPEEPAVLPVTELILDPSPAPEMIASVLRPYGFQDTREAYAQVQTLAQERIPFLSTRRCRHFLSEISPSLLQSIGQTPDPDFTLSNLVRVSESLGGKGVLWELFRANPPSLQLYVRLCGASSYLSDLLTSSPGMIDELLDSLLLDRLPTGDELLATAASLTRAAEHPQPVLAGFKNSQHLRVGLRELLGREDIAASHRALTDVAEACVSCLVQHEAQKLSERYGQPTTSAGDRCEFVILALGKYGGREPNYHSTLDLAFIYEEEGDTKALTRSQRNAVTTNAHYFQQLAQRVIKSLSELGPQGRLYETQTFLRPAANAGPLAISRAELQRHLVEDVISPADRQLLVKTRPIFGSLPARTAVANIIADSFQVVPWREEFNTDLRRLRFVQEETATGRNLKRAAGGTIDVETVIQVMQWQNVAIPGIIGLGTLAAIERLREAGKLANTVAESWSRSYRFLRGVESALRLMNSTARHDLPDSTVGWQRLAMLLQHADPQSLAETCRQFMDENRQRFELFFAGE